MKIKWYILNLLWELFISRQFCAQYNCCYFARCIEHKTVGTHARRRVKLSLINPPFFCNKSGWTHSERNIIFYIQHSRSYKKVSFQNVSFRYVNHHHREKKVQGKIPPLQCALAVNFLLFPFCNAVFCLAFPDVRTESAIRFYLHSADRNGWRSRNVYHISSRKVRSYSFRKEHHNHIVKNIIAFP